MPSTLFRTVGWLGLLQSSILVVSAVPAGSLNGSLVQKSSHPFKQLVVFGDELSDNGNGSWAHGIAGGDAEIYGFNTWTDGPVAVSYLANLLNIPLIDYAFGGCCGGSSSGATIDNNYTVAEAKWNGTPVPSAHDQIYNNFTAQKNSKASSSLAVLWVGQNDLLHQTDWFWLGDPRNAAFAANFSSRIVSDAEYLIESGVPAVLVPNIFPKQLAPVTPAYLCSTNSCVETLGQIIQNANTALQQGIQASNHSSKIIYYDVYSFMMHVMNNAKSYGLTMPLTEFCDGSGNATIWNECTSGPVRWDGAKQFFWNMKAAIDKFLS